MMNEAPSGPPPGAIELEIESSKEVWSIYKLSDGSTLRIKPSVISVFKDEKNRNPDGTPIFYIKAALISDPRSASEDQGSKES